MSHPLVRFWEKVQFDSSGCWLWTGAGIRRRKFRDRYGSFRVDGCSVGAHRWLYELMRGPIPEGLELDHLCRNPSCVNYHHLEPVIHVENCRRGDHSNHAGADAQARKAYCPEGHPYSSTNTYWQRNGRNRVCRECARRKTRSWYRANAARVLAKQRARRQLAVVPTRA